MHLNELEREDRDYKVRVKAWINKWVNDIDLCDSTKFGYPWTGVENFSKSERGTKRVQLTLKRTCIANAQKYTITNTYTNTISKWYGTGKMRKPRTSL